MTRLRIMIETPEYVEAVDPMICQNCAEWSELDESIGDCSLLGGVYSSWWFCPLWKAK